MSDLTLDFACRDSELYFLKVPSLVPPYTPPVSYKNSGCALSLGLGNCIVLVWRMEWLSAASGSMKD